jgi:hypothetical protein
VLEERRRSHGLQDGIRSICGNNLEAKPRRGRLVIQVLFSGDHFRDFGKHVARHGVLSIISKRKDDGRDLRKAKPLLTPSIFVRKDGWLLYWEAENGGSCHANRSPTYFVNCRSPTPQHMLAPDCPASWAVNPCGLPQLRRRPADGGEVRTCLGNSPGRSESQVQVVALERMLSLVRRQLYKGTFTFFSIDGD